MRYLFVMLLLLLSGCAELHQHALGTRVQTLSIKGRDYVHCSILMDPAQPQLSHDALEVCRDGIRTPAPHK